MTRKELYEKYKGSTAIREYDGMQGIVCGYLKDHVKMSDYRTLIIASTTPHSKGWNNGAVLTCDIIVTHKNHRNGYWYVSESDILATQQPAKLSLWGRIKQILKLR